MNPDRLEKRSPMLSKRILFLIILLLFSGISAFSENAVDIKEIVLETSRKTENGRPTVVKLNHNNHSEKTQCSFCHDSIKKKIDHPSNNVKNMHDVCWKCHKKGLSAERISKCSDCHVKKR